MQSFGNILIYNNVDGHNEQEQYISQDRVWELTNKYEEYIVRQKTEISAHAENKFKL